MTSSASPPLPHGRSASLLLLSAGMLLALAHSVVAAPSLPTLPTQFSVDVEANFLELNSTMSIREYFDEDNNRMRREMRHNGSLTVHIANFAINSGYIISDGDNDNEVDFRDDECIRVPPSHVTRTDDGHIQTASDWFRFGEEFDETYVGVARARGILCDHWRAHVEYSRPSFRHPWNYTYSYDVHYFFSVQDWSSFSSGPVNVHRVPVRAHIAGTRLNTSDGSVHDFEHIYEFVRFWPQAPPADLFFPDNLYCTGPIEEGASPPLPTLPSQFSTVVEANIINKNYTIQVREFYDADNGFARFDRRSHTGEHHTSIHDFKQHAEYHLSYVPTTDHILTPTEVDCTIRALERGPDVSASGGIMTTADMFEFGAAYDETYVGRRVVRGIAANRWDTIVNHTMSGPFGTFEMKYSLSWYFSVPEWGMFRGSVGQVPLRAEIVGQRASIDGDGSTSSTSEFHHVYDFVSFWPGKPSYSQLYAPLIDDVQLNQLTCDHSEFCEEYPENREICNAYPAVPFWSNCKTTKTFNNTSEIVILAVGVASFIAGMLIMYGCSKKKKGSREERFVEMQPTSA